MAIEIIKAEGGVAIENFVNITTELGGLALQAPSLASVAYIKKNTSANRAVKIYAHPTLASIKDVFGLENIFYKMGLAANSQSPSLFTRGGTVYTVEYNTTQSVPAIPAAIASTTGFSGNLTAIKALSSPTLGLSFTYEDGFVESYRVTPDFSTVANANDVLTALTSGTQEFKEEDGTWTVFEGGIFTFTQGQVTTAPGVTAFSNLIITSTIEGAGKIKIVDVDSSQALLTLLNLTTGVVNVEGSVAFNGVTSVEEALVDFLDKVALCKNIIFAEHLSDTDREAVSLQAEANEILNFEAYDNVLDAQAKKNVSLGRYWTRMFYTDKIAGDNTYKTLAAYQSRLWGVDLSANSLTMNLKRLAGVDPVAVKDTLYKELLNAGLNIFTYIKSGGIGVGLSSKNDFDDNLQNLLYIKQSLKYALLNLLVGVDKVSFDDEGLTLIENVIRNTASRFVDASILGRGLEWTEPKLPTYSTVEQFRKDIRNQGFHISLKPASKYTQAERETRKAVGEIFVKLGGAVHTIDLTAIVER